MGSEMCIRDRLVPNDYHVAEKYFRSAIESSFSGNTMNWIPTSGIPIARQIELTHQVCDRAAGPGQISPRNLFRSDIANGMRSAVTKGEIGSSINDQAAEIHGILWFPHFDD